MNARNLTQAQVALKGEGGLPCFVVPAFVSPLLPLLCVTDAQFEETVEHLLALSATAEVQVSAAWRYPPQPRGTPMDHPTTENQTIAAGAARDVADALTKPANVTIVFDRKIVLRVLAPDVELEIVDPHTIH